MAFTHDAFISYSHQADAAFGPALEQGLEQLAHPFWKRRACDVFLDQSSLGIDSSVWGSIEPHLAGARWFILLASPQSAQSPWCRREVAWWLQRHGTERLLIVVTAGEVATQPDGSDFDWARTTALPDVLAGRYTQVPLFGDLRPVPRSPAPTMRHAAFRRVVVGLAATMRGVPRDALDAEDLASYRRNRRVAAAALAAIVGLAGLSGWATLGGIDAGRAALAGRLVDQAQTQGARRPAEALLLAALARRLGDEGGAAVVLADTLNRHPHQVRTVVPAHGAERPVTATALDGPANLIAVARCDEGPVPCPRSTVSFQAIEGAPAALPAPLALALGTVQHLAFARDGGLLLVVADDGAYTVDLRMPQPVPQRQVRGVPVAAAALSADGALFAAALAPPGAGVELKIWRDGRYLQCAQPLPDRVAAHGLVWSADGRFLAVTDGQALTTLVDLQSSCAQRPQPQMRDTAAMAFDRAGSTLYAAARDGSLASAATQGAGAARRFGGGQPLQAQQAWLQRSPHAMAAEAGWVALADGERIRIDPVAAPADAGPRLEGAPSEVVATRLSADARWLLSTQADRSVVLWRALQPLSLHERVRDAAAPAAGWQQGSASRADGALLARIGQRRDPGPAEGETPRYRWTLELATGAGRGGDRRAVELADGDVLADPPQALQFGADGTLWVKSEQGAVTRWDIGPAALEARACRFAGRAPDAAELDRWLAGERLLRWRIGRDLPCTGGA